MKTVSAMPVNPAYQIRLTAIQLALGVSVGASILAGFSIPAMAQTTPDENLKKAQQEASESGVAAIDTIIVTARKKSEFAQRIPIAMDVLSGSDLKDAGITRVQDIQANTPGLVIAPQEAQAGVSIRGVGTGDVGLGTDQSVAIHIDGVYQAFGGSGLARLFDVQRVEVLKGPQGTLYGRNSTGGVVNVISRAPQNRFESEVGVSAGSLGLRQVQGVINAPLGEQTAARLAFITSDSDDWLSNGQGLKTGAADDFLGLRGRIRTALGQVSADLSVQYIEDNSTYNWALIRNPGNPIRTSAFDTGIVTTKPVQTNKDLSVALRLSGEVGPVTLTSITGYGRHRGNLAGNWTGPGGAGISLKLDGPYNESSQEFQAALSNGSTEWTAGLFFINSDGRDKRNGVLTAPKNPAFVLFEQDTEGSYAQGRSWAMFGDVTHKLSPDLKLNAGLRYTQETKTATIWGTTPFDIPYPGVADSSSYNNVSGRLGLDYSLNKQTIVYGGVARGFKSGGAVPMGIDPSRPIDIYKPELLTSYEIGQKTTLPDGAGTFNAGAFLYDYKDKVELFSTDPNNPLTLQSRNVQKAKLYGLETSIDYRVARNFRIDANVALLSTEYTKFYFIDSISNSVVDLTGNRLSRAPSSTYTLGLVLDKLAMSFGQLSGRLEYFHRSQIYFDAYNTNLQPNIDLVNASARLESTSQKWSLSLSARNLTNKKYLENNFGGSALPALGRTWQLGANFKF